MPFNRRMMKTPSTCASAHSGTKESSDALTLTADSYQLALFAEFFDEVPEFWKDEFFHRHSDGVF